MTKGKTFVVAMQTEQLTHVQRLPEFSSSRSEASLKVLTEKSVRAKDPDDGCKRESS